MRRAAEALTFAGYIATAALFLWVVLPAVRCFAAGRAYLDERRG